MMNVTNLLFIVCDPETLNISYFILSYLFNNISLLYIFQSPATLCLSKVLN